MGLSMKVSHQPLPLDRARPIHFVGIGGIGMSALAKALLVAGFRVSGSDLSENAYTQVLQRLGGRIFIGHAAEHVPENAVVIVSTSIERENPEIATALSKGLMVRHRSDLLREILHGKTLGHQTTVGITGSHGKTTITGMLGLALHQAGQDPTVIAGGKMPIVNTNAILGQSRKIAVAELDESDGSLVQYQPSLSVIANLELDHADHYTTGLQGVMDVFREYLQHLPPDSKVFYNVGCPNTRQLAESPPVHIQPILLSAGDVFTGQERETTYWLKNARHYGKGCYQAYVYRNAKMLGELNMSVPGRHNLFNALCAVAAGDQLGVDVDGMLEAIREFSGMGRRFEKVGEWNNALLIDDYAHHPSEVQATLKAAKESLQGTSGRVIAIFQAHRPSRLKALWDEFLTCFEDADQVFITDVYAASESPIPGVDGKALAEAIQRPNVAYVPQDEDFVGLRETLKKVIQPGDLVLSLGAGDITQLLRRWDG